MRIRLSDNLGLLVCIADRIHLHIQVGLTVYKLIVFRLQRHRPGVPVIFKLIRSVQRLLSKKNGTVFIRIAFVEGYRHCARSHAVPVGSVIPEYGQGHLLLTMVGDRDDMVLVIHLPCRGIGVCGSVRQHLTEHVVCLHALQSFGIIIK